MLFDTFFNIVDLVKVFLKAGIQIRHEMNMPPMNFGVSDVQVVERWNVAR